MSIPQPRLEESFRVSANVGAPIIVGRDDVHGLRRLIPITSGAVTGRLNGAVLPGGIDSQIVRPNGFTELSARYGLKLDDGNTVYIENTGLRRVDPFRAAEAAAGMIVEPRFVYFAAVPKFEVYSDSLRWLEQSVFICYAVRYPDMVLLGFYEVI